MLMLKSKYLANDASSIASGDQEACMCPSKIAPLRSKNEAEAIPTKAGAPAFFAAYPAHRPNAPPNASSLTVSKPTSNEVLEAMFKLSSITESIDEKTSELKNLKSVCTDFITPSTVPNKDI